MLKIRRTRDRLIFNMDRLIFNMEIPISGKDGLYIETWVSVGSTLRRLLARTNGTVWCMPARMRNNALAACDQRTTRNDACRHADVGLRKQKSWPYPRWHTEKFMNLWMVILASLDHPTFWFFQPLQHIHVSIFPFHLTVNTFLDIFAHRYPITIFFINCFFFKLIPNFIKCLYSVIFIDQLWAIFIGN